MTAAAAASETLAHTPLYALHLQLGGRMVPFAGYAMPVQYRDGILHEHLHTRSAAGLFDVSHMGHVRLSAASVDAAAEALERLVPADIVELAPGHMRYTQLLNDSGGILDDLMVYRRDDHLHLVINAACKEADIAHLRAGLAADCKVEPLTDRALLALQGPAAVAVFGRLAPDAAALDFMHAADLAVAGVACLVSRSGYTGEDGYEIALAARDAADLAQRLLQEPEVAPVGLGARDSLRLEAGLCLYGHDIDTTTTPVEAGLAWSIGKRRRAAGGFPGAAVIQRQLAEGVARRRVGLRPEGRVPARDGAVVLDRDGNEIGKVTSGGFGPSVGGPIAMGYVATAQAKPDTAVQLVVRDKPLPGRVVRLPFVPHHYHHA